MNTPGNPLRPHLAGISARALMAMGNPRPALWPEGYDYVRQLGAGGMGEVHLALDQELGREVAIKLVHRELRGEPMILERLQREARLMSSLNHPGLVVVHRLVAMEEGSAIVMEYIDGGNLRDLITSRGQEFPVNEAVRLARETAAAIGCAHRHGIVHRDLKPENLLLTCEGHIKVTDFGLAMDPVGTRLTMAGTTAGTADYMAPERHSGGDAGPLGDIYALGVILYEMLTGSLPRGHFDTPRALRADIPQWLSEAVMRALKSDPRQRFATMAELGAALAPTVRVSKRLVAGVLVAGLAVAGIFTWQPPAPTPASGLTTKADPADWTNALVNPYTISGNWRSTPDGWVSDNRICILKLADSMPASYEVRMTFTRLEGQYSIALFFRTAGGIASIDIDGWTRGLSGVQSINGQDLRNGQAFTHFLENQRRCELHAVIEPDVVRVFVDGNLKITTPIKGATLGLVSPWQWDGQRTALAIGSFQSPTRFSKIEWRPRPPSNHTSP